MVGKDQKVQEFPDVKSKLSAPTKKSLFERQKAEAEAKRQKEEEETAAVYEDFVKSFDDEGDAFTSQSRSYGHQRPPARSFAGPPGRGGRLSGPGSLGPPPPARKRFLDDQPLNAKAAFQNSDDEDDLVKTRTEEKKPTLHLSSLPPGTSVSLIKSLMPTNLKVDSVRLLKSEAKAGQRKTASALVILTQETPAGDLDAAVSSLQNRYLGRGFYLSLSRHLSSSVASSALAAAPNASKTLPFGAKVQPMGRGFGRMPPQGAMAAQNPPVQVQVTPPADLKQLKLIHKTVEDLFAYGPEFEALLMSRPEVQQEEKWAWIWDPSSVGGVWYRWRIWETFTGSKRGGNRQLFSGGAPWTIPERKLPFEYITRMDEFVGDSDYDSSDDSDDEGARNTGPEAALDPDAEAYMNPLQKAKLIHLLSRLPETNAKLRRGDVARITSFAIKYAGGGAEEVADVLVANVHKSFSPAAAENPDDPSPQKLIGLFLISDVLSSSSTSGVRHAWRYRQLFENCLMRNRTFEHLGSLEKELNWGRLRAEKWKRAVGTLLSLWEGWCVFPAEVHEAFVRQFEHPPALEADREQAIKAQQEAQRSKAKNKWKTVTEKTEAEAMDVDEPDLDGEPMDDEDLDGVPMEEEESEEEPEAKADDQAPQRRKRPRAEDMFADSD